MTITNVDAKIRIFFAITTAKRKSNNRESVSSFQNFSRMSLSHSLPRDNRLALYLHLSTADILLSIAYQWFKPSPIQRTERSVS